jgi:ribonuclease HI
MEIMAAVEALRLIPHGSVVQLSSDSELLIHGMCFLAGRWQKQGWLNNRGIELQHQELWRELLGMNERMNIRWQWIRGHSGHPFQTRADGLAYKAARTQWSESQMAA